MQKTLKRDIYWMVQFWHLKYKNNSEVPIGKFTLKWLKCQIVFFFFLKIDTGKDSESKRKKEIKY